MKKVLILQITALLFGCTHNSQTSLNDSEDSTLYKIDENHAVIYNISTGKDEVVKLASEMEDGTIKVTDNGDTLYWLGGDTFGKGEYISKEEWHTYCKEKEELYKRYE
jgi:hypothetical protein